MIHTRKALPGHQEIWCGALRDLAHRRVLRRSQGDERDTNQGEDRKADEITLQIMMLNALDDHDAVVSDGRPASKQYQTAVVAWAWHGVQQKRAKCDVNAQDHLILPVDGARDAIPERSEERIQAG